MVVHYNVKDDSISKSNPGSTGEEKAFERFISVISMNLRDYDIHDSTSISAAFRSLVENDTMCKSIAEFDVTRDGKTFSCQLIPEYDCQGNILSLFASIRDITNIFQLADLVGELKNENEILLKEIYHRVFNNLQIIESLLRLQIHYTNDAIDLTTSEKLIARIHAISLIQHRLYIEKSYAQIHFDQYIDEYIDQIKHKRNSIHTDIVIHRDVGNIILNIRNAIPCALLLHELVSNSLQHAFPDGRKGVISVTCKKLFANKGYVLEVEDNGTGLPDAIDTTNPTTFGMVLIQTLASQLNATLLISRGTGLKFSITFENISD